MAGSLNCSSDCHMSDKQKGEFDVVAILRIITACLSILGAFSIVGSAVYRKTVCNPKVHPIFVLSVVDLMLSVLWISGSVVWLREHEVKHRVRCFTINLMTVILQCVAMNLTLIYALLAYWSIRQRDFTGGVYMVQQRPVSVHVWPPLCSFLAYLIAWVLPVVLIMVPFWVLSKHYQLVENANNCSCWCLPYYGNVTPRPRIGYKSDLDDKDTYLLHLHAFITSYAVVLSVNFIVVFLSMVVIYYKVFRRIRRMKRAQEQNENTPLYGATQAMILEGQKDAKKRVFLFLTIYFITGIITFAYGMDTIIAFSIREREVSLQHNDDSLSHQIHRGMRRIYIIMLFEAILVPLQGGLNAIAYGWTRGDFLNVMSTSRINSHSRHTRAGSYALSYEAMAEKEETVVEDDGEEWEDEGIHRRGNSLLFSASHEPEDQGGGGNAMTPGTPGVLLGEEDRDLY